MTNDNPPPTSDSGSPFSDDMAQYLQVYIDESEEELDGLVEAILKLEGNPHHDEALHKAFRMLHSLKGSSGMLGFEIVGNFAHELEDRFERYRSGQAILDRETTTLVLKCVDYFRLFLGRLRSDDLNQGDPTELLNQLQEHERHRSSNPETPAVVMTTMPVMTISGGLHLVVRFRPGLQLADLKARLIVARLSSIGEIISCEPPIDDAHSFDELPLFSLTLVTDRKIDEVRKIANVDGVEAIEIQGNELNMKLLVPSGPVPSGPTTIVEPPPERPFTAEATTPAPPESSAPPDASAIASDVTPGKSETEAPDAKIQSSETLRVDIGRLDRLMNLTGELVVANARFSQIASDMSPLFRNSAVFKKSRELTDRLRERFESLRQSRQQSFDKDDVWMQITQGLDEDLEALDRQSILWAEGHRHFADISDAVDQLTRVSKNLQRGVLNTRMVPVGPLFNRFKRVIRDLSTERRKQVQLIIQGEKTELDKRMIDALGDPLLHLVRNSIDHGMEGPEQRRAAGKPVVGTIVLEAAHRGNSVWITVRDDGAGINTDRIRTRIIERGLATAAQVNEMTEAQTISHIWHPGFSTAESVTEISGRGVGMDIVRSTISELSGTIEVASTPGVGTTFTIRLPLTLAIIHSLMMRYQNDYFSIPLDDVREIVSIPRDQIHVVHRHVTIDVRGELISLVSMKGIFKWGTTSNSPELSTTSTTRTANVVVIHARGKTLGLTVDSLVGRADLVIKSLTENFQPVRGLSGASILGDGAVCLMIDSAALIDLAAERTLTGAV
ncbi:chemotaxis protein CheA [Schlesneria paludicola]|uniref:chemotaxis protein CheA n=1 Tax=Schlesneria paludicola TaxID=360056 RepID=UPI00029A998E|nr:chemotaxis protein CheA [Schlesneria paludicola]